MSGETVKTVGTMTVRNKDEVLKHLKKVFEATRK